MLRLQLPATKFIGNVVYFIVMCTDSVIYVSVCYDIYSTCKLNTRSS